MNIQSYVFVRDGVTSCTGPTEVYDIDFANLQSLASYFHTLLINYKVDQIFVFLDAFRFALVTEDSCDFHYHFKFNKKLYEKKD